MSVMYRCSLEALTKEHLVLREVRARLRYGALVSNLVFQKYQQSLSRLMKILVLESNAFVVPGCSILGINLDGLIERNYGRIASS